MKLYYLPGACSLASHIVLIWSGADYELERLSHETEHAAEFITLNPKGAVPTITIDTGSDDPFVLTESLAVLLYIAAKHPAARLGAAEGDVLEQARINEIMAELVSEVHKAFVPAFVPDRFVIDESAADGARVGRLPHGRKRRSGASTIIWRVVTGWCSIVVRSLTLISTSCRDGWPTRRRRSRPFPTSRDTSRRSTWTPVSSAPWQKRNSLGTRPLFCGVIKQ